MGTFNARARQRGAKARRMNMVLRTKMVAQFGGKVQDYFPKNIEWTINERNIPLDKVPPVLRAKLKEQEHFPLDHPIFEKPKKLKAKPVETREQAIIHALLDVIRKLV